MLIVIVDYTSMARPGTHRSPRSPSHVLLDGHFVFLHPCGPNPTPHPSLRPCGPKCLPAVPSTKFCALATSFCKKCCTLTRLCHTSHIKTLSIVVSTSQKQTKWIRNVEDDESWETAKYKTSTGLKKARQSSPSSKYRIIEILSS